MKYRMLALFLLGLAGIVAVFTSLGLPEILSAISRTNPLYIVLAFLMEILTLVLLGFKLGEIARGQGSLRLAKGRWSAGTYQGIRFKESFKATVMGMTMSFITPIARVGGEPLKIMILRKNGINTASATAVVATDTFTEVFSYYLIVMASIAFIIASGMLPLAIMIPFLLIFIISSCLLVLFFVMCLNYSILSRIFSFAKRISKRIATRFERHDEKKEDAAWTFYDTFTLMLSNKPFLIRIFVISFFVKMLEFLRIYFIFLAFGYNVHFSTIILSWSIMLLVGMIPATPGGLGLVEAGGAYAYILFGVEKSVAGAVMILDRLFSFWFVIFLGMVFMSPEKLRKRAKHILGNFMDFLGEIKFRLVKSGRHEFGRKFGTS